MKFSLLFLLSFCIPALGEPTGFSSWAAGYGIPADEADDSDHDKIPAFVEYALGLDPTVPDGSPGVLNGSTLLFAKNPAAVAAGDVIYTIETSPNMDPGCWAPVTPDTDDAGTISYTLPAGQGKIFARLAVASRPTPPGMTYIPPGSFQRGDNFDEGNGDEVPVRNVQVDGFFMDITEVPKELWEDVKTWGNAYGYVISGGQWKGLDHPVHSVTWYEAVKWCNARSEKEGLEPCYYANKAQTIVYKTGEADITNAMVKWSANGYRLPTEAEWEKAARGGTDKRRFPWGNTISHTEANFRNDGGETYQTGTTGFHPTYMVASIPYTAPVASFAPNDYGLHDMSGNLQEWCWDWYDEGYYAMRVSLDNPKGLDSGTDRVRRGGSWNSNAAKCRCSFRTSFGPSVMVNVLGFRTVRR